MRTYAVSAAVALTAACSEKPPPAVIPAEVHAPGIAAECEIDDSIRQSSAWPLDLDAGGATTLVEGRLCPRADIDYWSLELDGERTLVDIIVQADTISNMRLTARWYGPEGLCVPEPGDGCVPECDIGEFCDLERGGCRDQPASDCFAEGHCVLEKRCAVTHAYLDSVYEDAIGSIRHRLAARLPAFFIADGADTYVLGLEDSAFATDDANFDMNIRRVQDPDTHEPNNHAHLATLLTSGATETGYFSYSGDEDWYVIDPTPHLTTTTRPVVTVEVTWPRDVAAEPWWVVQQGDWEVHPPTVPDRTGDRNVSRRTLVAPGSEPLTVHLINPSGALDIQAGYTVTVTVIEDLNEVVRNDTPATATVVDATTFGLVHTSAAAPGGGHTLVAENDIDWFRIDRMAASGENSLLHLSATADPLAPFLLQAVFYEQGSETCDPVTEVACEDSGDLCVCAQATCAAGEGACIHPWTQVPMPMDPGGDAQEGGRSPNLLRTQLPIFSDGNGALFVQISHIRASIQDRDGYSSTEVYALELTHKDEPDPADESADRSEYMPLPFANEVADFFDARATTTVPFSVSSSSGTEGFVTVSAGQQAVVDVGASTCVAIALEVVDNHGDPVAAGASTSATLALVGASTASLVTDCSAQTPLPAPTTLSGPTPAVGLLVPAAAFAALPADIQVHIDGAAIEASEALLTVTDTPLPQLTFTTVPPFPGGPAGAPARFFHVTEPSPAIQVALPTAATANLVTRFTVSAAATMSSADFGPNAQYCVCDTDCVDVCNCAGASCGLCACEPDPLCSDARGCDCTDVSDGACPGLAAPYDLLSPPCFGVLYGSLAQQTCEKLIGGGDTGTAVHVARTTPGVVSLHASAAGHASSTWVLVSDYARTLVQTPPGLSASGWISYAGDQDWFEMQLPDFAAASARLEVAYAPSTVDIRFRVQRGDDPNDDGSVTGLGRGVDICDLPEESCAAGGTCDTDRNACSYDELGTTTTPVAIDPVSDCTFMSSTGDRLYVWVNDVDYNDWDEVEPYSFRVELVEGCSAQCSPLLCDR